MTPPPDPPERRPLPQPKRPPVLDQQPERHDVRHAGVDGSPQRALKRTDTLPQMVALKAPPVAPGGTLTGLPAPAGPGSIAPPPALPAEFAATKRPPLPWGKTIRAATPPSAVALARRTDPPPAGLPSPETDAPTGQPGASLPPASSHPDAASAAALRRELAEAKRAAEAEADTRKRLELELAAKVAAEEAAARKRPADPERIWGVPLRNALIAFMAAVTALGAPAAVWLTARAESAKQEAEQQKLITAQLQATVADAKKGSGKATLEAAASKAELAAFKAYFREVMRLQGIDIAKREGDPDPGNLKVVTPLCQAGKVCPGPQLIITVPP